MNGLRVEELRAVPGVASVELRGETLRIGVRDLAADSVGNPQMAGRERGHPFHHLASERASLETVFLNLTGRSLRD